jgi:hypothetical protein
VAIFTDAVTASLSSALVVIELHEWIAPGAETLLRERFARTRSCEIVPPSARDPDRYALVGGWSAEDRALALSEWHGHAVRLSNWAIFRPRGTANA